tara:strand:+ start:6906 stop:8240 length:1335 start_codon:yes stop_codon:yes gene_type:complete
MMKPMESSSPMESSAPPCQVDELLSALRQVRRHPGGYRAIHLHFSLLDRHHQQPYHRRQIATAFNKLVKNKQGRLFWTRKFDVLFMCKDASISEMDIAIVAARRAVQDSPIIKEYKDAGRDADLCDWYDLEKDLDQFVAKVETLKVLPDATAAPAAPQSLKDMVKNLVPSLTSEKKEPEKPLATTRPLYDPIALRKPVVPPMGPVQLDQLERNLVNIEMQQLLSQQTAYVIVGQADPQPIFVEHFVSVSEIKNKFLPNYNIHADKWLFQRLTRTFDRKLMRALPEKYIDPYTVTSININVETVFTPEFDTFIAKFKKGNHQPLILEMCLFDVMSDIRNYYKARDKLTQLDCRISMDAIDAESLAVLDREILSVDFLKINWRADYKNLLGSAAETKIIDAIKDHGKMRIVLCHCDTPEALEFGKAAGVHMYQGFLIDKKYGPSTK